MKHITLPLIALALVGCSGGNNVASPSGGGGGSSAGETVTLKLKPKVGTTYVLENTSDANGQSSATTMTTKILESNDSNVVMESIMSGATGPGASANGMKMTITASPLYQIQSVKIDSKDPMLSQMGKAMESSLKMMPIFPDKPLKNGDTWKSSFDLGKMMTDMGLPVTFKGDTVMEMTMTFKGVEDKDGRKVAVISNTADDKITMSMNGQDQDMTMSIAGENYFDLETGMSVGSSTTTKSSVMGQETTNKNTIKLKEVK
jgi:hypothetical protein